MRLNKIFRINRIKGLILFKVLIKAISKIFVYPGYRWVWKLSLLHILKLVKLIFAGNNKRIFFEPC